MAEYGVEVVGDGEENYIKFKWNILEDEHMDMEQLKKDIIADGRARGERIEKR